MSILPACSATSSRYRFTPASSRASTTVADALPPAAVICSATASKLGFVRPAKKTRAPSAANSLATAAPIEPPAPKTTAHLFSRIPSPFQTAGLSVCFSSDVFMRDIVLSPLVLAFSTLQRLRRRAADMYLSSSSLRADDAQTLDKDYDELEGWMLNQPGPSWDILRSANHGNDADPGPDEGLREKPLRGFRQQAERRRDTHEHDAGVSRSRWTRG